MSLLRRSSLTLVGTIALTAALTAHVRLRYQENGAALFWPNPENVTVVINSDGSDDLSNDSHATAIRSAIDAWNAVDGSRIRLQESTSESARSRRDWQSNDIHTVLFDEDNASGYFAGASGIVAITPVTFFTSGEIIDADVLFNGKNFAFTTSGQPGRFDVQDIAAHELGHLIGLDHSGVCGATMYPYVDSTVILHRSLALDDERGARSIYPGWSFASIQGAVERTGGSRVPGAHVVARDDSGRVASANLTDGAGNFSLQGLSAGTYTVYADPLDQPVSSANLGGGQTILTDFEATILGTVTIGTGETRAIGTQTVGADVDVSIGRVSDDYPVRLVSGETRSVLLRGSFLDPGSTLTISDPSVSVTNVTWNGGSVSFDATVPGGAEGGHLDVTIETPRGERDILGGGREVTPPDPTIASVTPGLGDPEGGDQVTIAGTGFRAGARVVVGDRIYRDGAAGGCTVVDSTTILLTTADTIAGEHDVVVIDSSGVEGRSSGAFAVSATPTLSVVFPAVGSASGGTNVTISGDDFVPGSLVEIGGIVQSNVTVDSPRRITVVTTPGVPGGPYIVRVTAPGGQFAETAFSYVGAPDPDIAAVTPDEGDRSGGSRITVLGSNFNADVRVVFGANIATGTGGTFAPSTFIDANTLEVTTPSSSVGTASLLVKDIATGQAAVAASAFTFTGVDMGEDSGGGGCAAAPLPCGPPSWRDVLGGAGWVLVLLLWAVLRALQLRAAPVPSDSASIFANSSAGSMGFDT